MQRIAPPVPPGLIGRETELAELARFCIEPSRRPYTWWQAEAWAGKSALMSTFVLRPPAEVRDQVRIVSFFITARLAAQDTREAFTQVLLEQLADLLGQALPGVLPEATTRDAYLLGLLTQTAAACEEQGRRLILVVDGLDEDRGVTIGPDAHSIAGLLPADPPAGMRVIVAGRPNPPVPDDVPGWHPLRDPKIIRRLPASAYAKDVQRLARQELQRLLRGSTAEQDVLGFLVAARGGLSASDLEELTGIPLWEVEEILHTAAGRAFTRRTSRWAPATGPETYLLAHEELQGAASRYLGSRRLDGYHARLHAWFDSYSTREWPPETPEYLLDSYYRLLSSLDDRPRMITCAGCLARHERMLDRIGGDEAALTEVRTAIDLIAADDVPDLASALALACHRDQLTDRNENTPTRLPAVWAALGQVLRAEALATSITDPFKRTDALAQVAAALAKAGQPEQAAAITNQAEKAAQSIPDPSRRVEALARVAALLAEAGQREQASAIAEQAQTVSRSITEPSRHVSALALVAAVLAEARQYEQAQAVTRSITDPAEQAQVLAREAIILAQAGQREQAGTVAGQAEETARSVTDPSRRADTIKEVTALLAAIVADEQAGKDARSITDPSREADAPERAAATLAASGQYEQAEEAALSIINPSRQADALTLVATVQAKAGQREQAAKVASLAEEVARSITDPDGQADALLLVAAVLAEAGQHEQAATVAGRAEEAARSITNPSRQAHALARVAAVLARAGQHEQAATVAGRAEEAARSITNPSPQADALALIAAVLAETGLHERAEAVAQSITDPSRRADALISIATVLPRAGKRDEAVASAGRAEAQSVGNPSLQAAILPQVAAVLAEAGLHERAEAVAQSITDPSRQADALTRIAAILAIAGHEQAVAVAGRAEAAARLITGPCPAGRRSRRRCDGAGRGRAARAGRSRGSVDHRPAPAGSRADAGRRDTGQDGAAETGVCRCRAGGSGSPVGHGPVVASSRPGRGCGGAGRGWPAHAGTGGSPVDHRRVPEGGRPGSYRRSPDETR